MGYCSARRALKIKYIKHIFSNIYFKNNNDTGRLVGYCSARRALKGDAKGDPCDSSAGAELSSL